MRVTSLATVRSGPRVNHVWQSTPDLLVFLGRLNNGTLRAPMPGVAYRVRLLSNSRRLRFYEGWVYRT